MADRGAPLADRARPLLVVEGMAAVTALEVAAVVVTDERRRLRDGGDEPLESLPSGGAIGVARGVATDGGGMISSASTGGLMESREKRKSGGTVAQYRGGVPSRLGGDSASRGLGMMTGGVTAEP